MVYRLVSINLSGTMQGPIFWPVGEVCEMEFSVDFAAPDAPHSPWQKDWPGLDEALQEALSCGDFQGGMGDLVSGTLSFTLIGEAQPGRTPVRRIVAKALEDMHAAADYLAPAA